MFPNLNAEQARYGHTNQYTASVLGLNRCTYEAKKRSGRFSMEEINKLCKLYRCSYAYLFNAEPVAPSGESA